MAPVPLSRLLGGRGRVQARSRAARPPDRRQTGKTDAAVFAFLERCPPLRPPANRPLCWRFSSALGAAERLDFDPSIKTSDCLIKQQSLARCYTRPDSLLSLPPLGACALSLAASPATVYSPLRSPPPVRARVPCGRWAATVRGSTRSVSPRRRAGEQGRRHARRHAGTRAGRPADRHWQGRQEWDDSEGGEGQERCAARTRPTNVVQAESAQRAAAHGEREARRTGLPRTRGAPDGPPAHACRHAGARRGGGRRLITRPGRRE